MLGFRLPFARRKGYGMGATGGTGAVMTSGLLTSLISYWKLDETSGTRYDSVVASANDLTDNNTVTYNPGKQGNAAQFTAANSETLSKASNASLQVNDQDFTVAFWVYVDSYTNTGEAVIWKNVFEWGVGFVGGGPNPTPRFFTAGQGLSWGSTLSLATWYFVVAWHDTTLDTLNIQVNNGTAVSAARTGSVAASGSALQIGRNAGAYLDGRVDEAGFWKRVLTATERTNLYNSGAGVTYPFVGVP